MADDPTHSVFSFRGAQMNKDYFSHSTAVIDEGAEIGSGAKIWHFAHIRTGAQVGAKVSLARDVYVDTDVKIGDNSRIQNGVSIYEGVQISRYCFVGPHVIFTNDVLPRVGVKDWEIVPTVLEDGCSIGAGAIIRCGISIGAFSMVGTGSLVTKSVAPFRLVHGMPATEQFHICACGRTQAALEEKFSPIRDCCQKNMEPSVLKVAQEWAEKLNALKSSSPKA